MSDSLAQNAFVARRIELIFQIAQDGFGSNGTDTVVLNQHRVMCRITSAGRESGAMCQLRVEGLTPALMNRLSIAQAGCAVQGRNRISVRAGQADGTMSLVFTGGIVEAVIDYAGVPNVGMEIRAMSMALPAAQPVAPTSFNTDVPVASVMQSIAEKSGLGFRNNGVETVMKGGVYYENTAAAQMELCAQAAGVRYDVALDTLTIWPGHAQASAAEAIEVSPATGLIGYPGYSQYGVSFRTLFNPLLALNVTVNVQAGTSIIAQTSGMVPPCNGLWVVRGVGHEICAQLPGGPWFSTVEAMRPQQPGQVGFAN